MKKKLNFKRLRDLFNQFRRGIFLVMSASILNNIINMLSNMVITRILAKQEYGIWSYTLNIYSYLNLITGLGLLLGAFQFGAENRGKEEEFKYYKYCLKMGLIVNTILVGGFLLATFWGTFALQEALPFIRAILPIILLEYVFQLMLTILRCENRINEYAKVLNWNTMLLAIGHCIGALFGVWGVLIGRYLGAIFSVILVLLKTKKEIYKLYNAKMFKHRETKALWHHSLFTGVSSALNWLLYLLDVSMIAALLQDAETVALYKVATLIPTALAFIPNGVITCILPDIIKNNKNRKWLQKNIFKAYLGLGALNFTVCGILMVFAPAIISVLSGEQYLAAVPVFRVLVCGYFVSGTFRSLSTNILAGLRCVNYNLFLSVMSCICDIVFNYFFILKYGMIGAAYATFGVDIVVSFFAFGCLTKKIYME